MRRRLTISEVYDQWQTLNSRHSTPLLTGWRRCAAAAGKTTHNALTHHVVAHDNHLPFPGVEFAETLAPSQRRLEDFGDMLDITGVRGPILQYTGKRGPSRWRQKFFDFDRAIAKFQTQERPEKVAKKKQEKEIFLQALFAFDFHDTCGSANQVCGWCMKWQ